MQWGAVRTQLSFRKLATLAVVYRTQQLAGEDALPPFGWTVYVHGMQQQQACGGLKKQCTRN